MSLLSKNMLGMALVTVASAVSSITDQQMTDYLNAGALGLADAYAPIYFFGQSQNQPPCYPTWAFSGTPDTPDVFDTAHQTPSGAQCDYPDVGCNCRNPGVDIGNPGPPFPIYYSFAKCNDTEVRVAYNLFYEKDGATFAGIETGHPYDWERIIIVHSMIDSGDWAPSRALYSAHSGYNSYNWGDIQNTLTTEEIQAGDALSPNGVQGNEHPKVYVGWSKHPNFDDRNTGWNDPASQSDGNAFRSQDWWYYVDPKYYVLSDRSTTAGQALSNADWGTGADSNPPKVQDSICSQ